MKRCIAVFLTVILMMTLTACGQDKNQAVAKRYRDLESYATKMQVTVTGNKNEAVYELSQMFLAPDNYRTEVLAPKELEGTVSIISGGEIHLIGGNTPAVSFAQSRTDGVDYLAVADFFRAYFDRGQMEEADGKMILRVLAESENPYRKEQVLQLHAKTLMPETMLVSDGNGNPVVQITFTDFTPNIKIEKSVFTP